MNLSDFMALPDREKEAIFHRAMVHAGLSQDVIQLKLRVRRLEEICTRFTRERLPWWRRIFVRLPPQHDSATKE